MRPAPTRGPTKGPINFCKGYKSTGRSVNVGVGARINVYVDYDFRRVTAVRKRKPVDVDRSSGRVDIEEVSDKGYL
jgi:hypothetical protein